MGSLFNGNFQALGFNVGEVHRIRDKGQHFKGCCGNSFQLIVHYTSNSAEIKASVTDSCQLCMN